MACTKSRTLSLALLLALSGCAINTPDEYRNVIRGSRFGSVTAVDVARPLSAVTGSFKKKAAECLHYELQETRKGTIGSSTRTYAIARGTVRKEGARSTLLFQVKSVGNLAKEPEGGNFFLVADAEARGQGTRVTIYRATTVASAVGEAVRAWAEGRERGCPDPMRTFK